MHGSGSRVSRKEWASVQSVLSSKTALFGLILLGIVVVSALLAPLLAPHDPREQNLEKRLQPPAWMQGGSPEHPLGTDHLGRDILSRIIYGARVSLLVAVISVAVSGTIGTLLGLAAGYWGGRFDAVVTMLADVQLAFPFILLALAVMSVLGTGLRNVILVLGVTGWVVYTRLIRAEVLALREKEYIEAVRALGQKDHKIIWRHILPNVLPSVIVMASLRIANMIIAESSLTFMGLGVEPHIPTWGNMLADGREYITNAWWLATFPGLAIMLTVLAINLLGDWLRDRLDPRLQNSL
ncbi:MAG: ABC transporter permease [Firmicutes bacterium]|nr:ABC transporter permease [Bacillota bacterium]